MKNKPFMLLFILLAISLAGSAVAFEIQKVQVEFVNLGLIDSSVTDEWDDITVLAGKEWIISNMIRYFDFNFLPKEIDVLAPVSLANRGPPVLNFILKN